MALCALGRTQRHDHLDVRGSVHTARVVHIPPAGPVRALGPGQGGAMDGLPRVIDRHSANALGLTDSAIRHRVRTGRWRALHRGVYFTRGREPRDGDRLSAALLAAGPGSALSAAAALAQWRIRGIAVPARPLVLVPLSSGARSTPTVLVRRTVVPFDVRVVNDLRVTSIARAAADYSVGLARRDDVRAVVSEVMRRRLCTVEQLQSALSGVPRRGSAHLRLAVEEAALGAWSVPEAHLGRALRRAGLPRFQQNVELVGPDGTPLGIVDAWWSERRAALEVLGAEHHSSPADWAQTVRRAARLQAHGIAVLQVTAWDVLNRTDEVVAQVRTWLAGLTARHRTSDDHGVAGVPAQTTP